jgi:hypothetical protein
MPTKVEQCSAFAKETNDFFSRMVAEHEQCLAQHESDQKETAGGIKCSRSACQRLHDFVYGGEQRTVREAVDKCYADVREATERQKKLEAERLAREAQAANREADRKELEKQEAQRKAQREKDAAERAQQKAAQDAKQRAAEEASRSFKLQQDKDFDRRMNEALNKGTKPGETAHAVKNKSGAELLDPYGETKVTKQNSEAQLADPYDATTQQDQRPSEMYVSSAKKSLETAIDAAKETLNRDISVAHESLSGRKLKTYLQEASDTKEVLNGLGRMLQSADYAIELAAIYPQRSPKTGH